MYNVAKKKDIKPKIYSKKRNRPKLTTPNWWRYVAPPSVSTPYPATATAHADAPQSNTVYWSHPVDGIPHPNPSRNSYESCTFLLARKPPQNHDLHTVIVMLQIPHCWKCEVNSRREFYTRWMDENRDGGYSCGIVRKLQSRRDIRRIPRRLHSKGAHLNKKRKQMFWFDTAHC